MLIFVQSAAFLSWGSLRDPVKTPVRMTPEILFSVWDITGTIRMQKGGVKSLQTVCPGGGAHRERLS